MWKTIWGLVRLTCSTCRCRVGNLSDPSLNSYHFCSNAADLGKYWFDDEACNSSSSSVCDLHIVVLQTPSKNLGYELHAGTDTAVMPKWFHRLWVSLWVSHSNQLVTYRRSQRLTLKELGKHGLILWRESLASDRLTREPYVDAQTCESQVAHVEFCVALLVRDINFCCPAVWFGLGKCCGWLTTPLLYNINSAHDTTELIVCRV